MSLERRLGQAFKLELVQLCSASATVDFGKTPMTDRKIWLKATLVGASVGAAFGLAGFLLLTSWHSGMGAALFLLVPVAAGFSIAIVARGQNSATAAGFLSLISSLAVLITTGKEGLLCAVLAFPISIVGLFIGVGLGALARKLFVSTSTMASARDFALLLTSRSASPTTL